jgi:hypothetical protein
MCHDDSIIAVVDDHRDARSDRNDQHDDENFDQRKAFGTTRASRL